MFEQSQPLWRRLPRPLQKVYAYFVIAGIVIRLPWWLLKFLVPAARPKKDMPVKKCFFLQLIRTSFLVHGPVLGVLVRSPNAKLLEIGADVEGLLISPLPEFLVAGKLRTWANTANVSPIPIPGYWIQKSKANKIPMGAPPSPDEKVILFLHGGAYVLLSAHPKDMVTNAAKGIVDAVPSVKRVLSLEYRLSAAPDRNVAPEDQNPFPAALMDALQGYWYLVHDVGFKESQIVVVGDSAGGNLALALTRYLVEHQASSPMPTDTPNPTMTSEVDGKTDVEEKMPAPPGHLILLSPWVDLSGSDTSDLKGSHYANRPTDYISLPDPPNAISAPASFIAPFGDPATISRDVYISPASLFLSDEEASFAGFPRSFVAAGGGEVLLDQIRKLQERMKMTLGDECVYFEAESAFHDYLVFPNAQPERRLTLDAIRVFLDS